jgi:phosphopantothenoylcysteine decarboxylase/phosphopantothenate--cysteine ligase
MDKVKTVVIGVTGGIAAYKMPNLASMLKKNNFNVEVILTENACNFITPNTFEALTGNRCITDTFDRSHSFDIEHISLAKKADCFIIAPASANIIGKIANGIADDMLSTTVMACKCPVIIAPSMNTGMLENPIVQENIAKLKKF